MEAEKEKKAAEENERDFKKPQVCQDLKAKHDECFYKWYQEEFLTGKAKEAEPCHEAWLLYNTCVSQRLHALQLEHLLSPSPTSSSSSTTDSKVSK